MNLSTGDIGAAPKPLPQRHGRMGNGQFLWLGEESGGHSEIFTRITNHLRGLNDQVIFLRSYITEF